MCEGGSPQNLEVWTNLVSHRKIAKDIENKKTQPSSHRPWFPMVVKLSMVLALKKLLKAISYDHKQMKCMHIYVCLHACIHTSLHPSNHQSICHPSIHSFISPFELDFWYVQVHIVSLPLFQGNIWPCYRWGVKISVLYVTSHWLHFLFSRE